MTNHIDLTNGYGEAALHRAFDQVKNRKNWKLPIDAYVDEADIAITDEAIVFFTGSTPTFTREGDQYHVEADGYYVAIGA